MTTNGASPQQLRAPSGDFGVTAPEVSPYTQEVSSYLSYLPGIYRDNYFLGRFLRIFEDVLTPVQAGVNGLTHQFDPALATASMLDFLAGWVGEDRPATLDEARFRKLVKASLVLHRWRGTKRGLRMALELATGQRPFITEYSAGLVLGGDASLGLNTSLESGAALTFNVAFNCHNSELDQPLIHATIQRYKPAHVAYTLSFGPEVSLAR